MNDGHALQQSYDETPYQGWPHYPTHPDCLATLGTLLGMTPPSPNGCRVLELGCGIGDNLIPMAATMPDCRFVGIDLSPRQIEEGQTVVAALGLTNIDLHARSILDVDERFGFFDYIICHGVYSWVPPPVQDKILAICRDHLTPQGLAFVSYNTYPGWHRRGLVRELMQFHGRAFDDPQTKVRQARAFLEFMADAAHVPTGPLGLTLRQAAEDLRQEPDHYVLHEYLEEINSPIYFLQFMERATAHGLQYVGESWYQTRWDHLPPTVVETLQLLSADLLHLEQHLDFVMDRTFRRTVLCHADLAVSREVRLELVQRMAAASLAQPEAEEPPADHFAKERFRCERDEVATTNIPLLKALLWCLHEQRPRAVPVEELWQLVTARMTAANLPVPESPLALAAILVKAYQTHLVSLHIAPPQFTTTISERPVASALARHQAMSGREVSCLRHHRVELNDFDAWVLRQLDGYHDQAAITVELADAVARHDLKLDVNGTIVTDPQQIRTLLTEQVPASLLRLAKQALLLA